MVGIFNYCCKQCGGTSFLASGIANDEPLLEQPDEWKYRLRFYCADCASIAAEVTHCMDGSIQSSEDFALSRGPIDPLVWR